MVARGRRVSAHSLAPRHIYNYRGRVHGAARTKLCAGASINQNFKSPVGGPPPPASAE